MDRKAQLMDFLDRPRGGDYRRGGRGGRGRGRGRGYSSQDNTRRGYSNFREQQGGGFGEPQHYRSRNSPQQRNTGPASPQYEESPAEWDDDYPQQQPQRRTSPQQAPPSHAPPTTRQATPPRQQQARQSYQAPSPPEQQQQRPSPQQQQAPPQQAASTQPQRGGGRGGRGKSITPDRISPKKNIEGVLECAPPLTVVETRTSYAVTQSGDVRKSPAYAANMGGPPQPQRQQQPGGT